MHKVYLLLRNNQQTGPHSLEELLQHNLKPKDLIWVEGKSCGWSYPAEIEVLKPYVAPAEEKPVAQQARKAATENKSTSPGDQSAKRVFVSLPGQASVPPAEKVKDPQQSLEEKAEALRKRAQSYTPTPAAATEELVQTNYARTINDVEEEYTNWVFKQKSSKKNKFSKQTASMATVGLLLALVIFIILKPGTETPDATTPAAMPASLQEPDVATANTEEPVTTEEAVEVNNSELIKEPVQKENKNISTPDQHTAASPKTNTPVKTETAATARKEKEIKAPVANNEVADANTTVPQTPAPENEKKSLVKKIDGLFDKIIGKKEVEGPASSPVILPDAKEERKTTKRDETAATPAAQPVVNLTETVDVISSTPSDQWMMGVKGLKITLKNRSDYTLKNAVVEVRYYTEQNELLEKKTVSFDNVPPKRSTTKAAPDHRLADHTELAIVSAFGQ